MGGVLLDARASSRCHTNSRLSRVIFFSTSSFSKLCLDFSKSSWLSSMSNFLVFRVRLWTAGFQWPRVFVSIAGTMRGTITSRFCATRVIRWSLFHKNKARSATCTKRGKKKPRWRNQSLFFRPTIIYPSIKIYTYTYTYTYKLYHIPRPYIYDFCIYHILI